MKNKKNYFLSITIFFLLFGFTFYYIFSKYSWNDLMISLQSCNKLFIGISILCVLCYLCCGSLFLKRICASFQMPITFFQSFCYNCIEIYFAAITPSSTGGQPVEAYYMAKDKIPYQKSTVAILINTILYKLTICLFGILAMMMIPKLIFSNGILFISLMFLGLILNILAISFFLCLIYFKNLPIKIVHLGINILSFFKLLKDKETKKESAKNALKEYHECARIFKTQPKLILSSFFIIIIQRIFLFAVSYFIYRAFGLTNYDFITIFFLQVAITLAIDSVPFPGGVMIGETLTMQINRFIYENALAFSSMILLRGISFYFLIFLASIFFVIYHFLIKFRNLSKKEKISIND